MAGRQIVRWAVVFAVLAARSRASATTEANLCPATANPCVVTARIDVDPDTILDFGNRAFDLRSPGWLTVAGGDLVINARSIRIGNGAKVVGLPDESTPALVIFHAKTDVQVDATGRVDVDSDTVPQRLEIYADGTLRTEGALQAR